MANEKQAEAYENHTGSQADSSEQTTHFGYQQVPVKEKVSHVAGVFHSVANKYDLMNDLMSAGSHRLLKRMTIEKSGVRPGHKILDLAGGTGDFAKLFSDRIGRNGKIFLTDINDSMLRVGRDRLIDAGLAGNIEYVQANGEFLPFSDNFFDCVTIGYGIRNFTNKEAALKDIARVLKPGGRLLILEFSTPVNPLLGKAYDAYSSLWPMVGKAVVGDSESYKYLNESIRMHPDQETLKSMMEDAGLSRVHYHNFIGGVSALHVGYKA